jgi:hypothetical protein
MGACLLFPPLLLACLLMSDRQPARALTRPAPAAPQPSGAASASPASPVAPLPPPPGALDVRALGARGDGVSDDQPVIQAALDKAPSGTTLYFPPGAYRLDSPLIIKKDAVKLIGAGKRSIIKHGDGPGLQLGVSGRQLARLVVSRLRFLGLPGQYMADGNKAKAISIDGPQGTVIQDCDFEGSGMAVFNSGGPTRGTQILNCRVEGWGEVGFFCNGGERIRHCSLIQDDPDPTGLRSSHAFYIHSGARDVVVADCLIEKARKFGIHLYGEEVGTTIADIQVLRNRFRDCRAGIIITAPSEGPMFRNIRIQDNRFEGVQETAIRIRKGDGITVRGNTITRCADGISLAEWPEGLQGYILKNVLVEDNDISHCNGGIWITVGNNGSLPDTIIRRNRIRGVRVTIGGNPHVPGVKVSP